MFIFYVKNIHYPTIATISGVMPSLFLAFISAPFCNSRVTMFSCPSCAATIKGLKSLYQLFT